MKISSSVHTTVHAEEHVCSRIPNYKKYKQALDVLVFRFHKGTNELVYSRPCKRCIHYMQICGIKNVYYSSSPNAFKVEKVSEMDLETAHVSRAMRSLIKRNSI